MKEFKGVPVVWLGTVLGNSTTDEFEKYFKEELDFNVKYIEEFNMIDGQFKDLTCLVFEISMEDVGRFAMFRLRTSDMKWMDDWIDNRGLEIPMDILKKYADKEQLTTIIAEAEIC